jgi:subtilisin family serine protease
MNRKLLLIALLAACSAQAAEVYKWVDANGVMHYSDSPPPKDAQKVEKVRVGGGLVAATDPAVAANPSEGEAGVPPDAQQKPKQPPQPPPAVDDTPENRAKLCSTAQSNLELLQSKFPVTGTNAGDGSQQMLDDKARQGRVAVEQQNVATYCK